MKYILATLPFVGIICVHHAWNSIECPILLSFAVLVCLIIKNQSNEQGKKKGTDQGD